MRKISINCRFVGNSCRVVFALCTTWQPLILPIRANAQAIQEPGAPTPAMPPSIPKDKDPVVLRQRVKQEKAKEDIRSREESREQAKDQKAQAKAYDEAHQPRPLYGFAEVSLLFPMAIVSAGRSNYEPDPTSHFSAYVRTAWGRGPESLQPWVGLRIAPFGGYGTQDRLTARFAHTWIGPAAGLGLIQAPADPLSEAPIRYGVLWSAGVAGVTRMAAAGESAKSQPKDFSPTPWSMDPPGVWSELRITRISLGALGLGVLAGIQTGSGKMFIYGGLTASGFY